VKLSTVVFILKISEWYFFKIVHWSKSKAPVILSGSYICWTF